MAQSTIYYNYNSENALSSVSNTAWSIGYLFDGVLDSGYVITLANDTTIATFRSRDPHRRELITRITNLVATTLHSGTEYGYNELGNITTRNNDTFDYNVRSEVIAANIQPAHYSKYNYDHIGNNVWTAVNTATNFFTANALNQYTAITAPLREPLYDTDGNLLSNGANTYTWDAENRLTSVSINNLFAVQNIYDPQHRRVVKSAHNKTNTFLYDGWLLIGEKIAHTSGAIEIREHVWGKDLSGTREGAGGVGGLLATRINNSWYFPLYDHNGNITDYINESGITVAHREYDAFGNTIVSSGPMVDTFNFWYSTKYLDHETNLYYYGYRFYDPALMRWLNRDPIAEQGGVNVYGFVNNKPILKYDALGKEPATSSSVNYEGIPISRFSNYISWKIEVGYLFGRYPIWTPPDAIINNPTSGGNFSVPLQRSRRVLGINTCWSVARLRVQANPIGVNINDVDSSYLLGNRPGDDNERFWYDNGPRRPNKLRYKPEVRFDVPSDATYNYGSKLEWTRPGNWYDVWWVGGTMGLGTSQEFFVRMKDYSLVPYGLSNKKTTVNVSARINVMDADGVYQSVNAFNNFKVKLE